MAEARLPIGLVTAIGRVTVNGTRLDTDVVVLMGAMVGYAGPRTRLRSDSPLDAPPDSFSRAVDDIRRLVRKRLRGPLLDATLAYLADAKRVYRQRNDVVHGVWSALPDGRGRHTCMLMRDPGRPLLLSVQEVDALADEIHRVRATATPLLGPLSAAMPHVSDTVIGLDADELAALRARHMGGNGVA